MSRTVVITGASGSMGSAAVEAKAAEGYSVIMACRNLEKGEKVRRKILDRIPSADLRLMELQLESFGSIRNFAEKLRAENAVIDALFNNAGVISRGYSLTEDGYEKTLAVNFLGPALLSGLIIPMMPPGAHIVNMVSLTCRFGNVSEDLFRRTGFSRLGTYSDTKLALLLFSIALSRHTSGIHINVADPGIVDSNMISMGKWFDPLADLFFRPFCTKPSDGVKPALRALECNDDLRYFVGKGDKKIREKYLRHPMTDWLWQETGKIISAQ